jgi:hypothetical protein
MNAIHQYPDELRSSQISAQDARHGRIATRSVGLFPASALGGPVFEGKDIAGLVAATVITLGPLAAYSFGFGA